MSFCTLLASVTDTVVCSVLVLLPVYCALMTSDALLTMNVSLPVPPTMVSTVLPATRVSLPDPATRLSAPLLAVITLLSVLPVSVKAVLPVPVKFCTLLASAMDTDVFSVLLPVLTPSVITSDALFTTNVSLPVPPISVVSPVPATSVSVPDPATSVSAPLLPVITLFNVLPVNVMAAVPMPLRF